MTSCEFPPKDRKVIVDNEEVNPDILGGRNGKKLE